MEHDMNYFKSEAASRGLCEEYALDWSKCLGDKEKLFTLCVRQQSIPYLATSIVQGWGLSLEYLYNEFADYLNGKYVVKDCEDIQGAKASMYMGKDMDIVLRDDVMHLCDFKGIAYVPTCKCTNLYLSNNTEVSLFFYDGLNTLDIYVYDTSKLHIIKMPENCIIRVYKYGEESSIDNTKTNGLIKIFYKKLKI